MCFWAPPPPPQESVCVVPEFDISFEFQVDNIIQGETTCAFLYLFDHLNRAIFHVVLKRNTCIHQDGYCKYIGHFRPTCISSIAMLIAVFAHVGLILLLLQSQHGGTFIRAYVMVHRSTFRMFDVPV